MNNIKVLGAPRPTKDPVSRWRHPRLSTTRAIMSFHFGGRGGCHCLIKPWLVQHRHQSTQRMKGRLKRLAGVLERWLSGYSFPEYWKEKKSTGYSLPEDPGSIPSIHMAVSITPVLFWSSWALGLIVAYRHSCRQNTHTHKKVLGWTHELSPQVCTATSNFPAEPSSHADFVFLIILPQSPEEWGLQCVQHELGCVFFLSHFCC